MSLLKNPCKHLLQDTAKWDDNLKHDNPNRLKDKLFGIYLLETAQLIFLLATPTGFLTMTDIQQRPSQAKLQLISNAALR